MNTFSCEAEFQYWLIEEIKKEIDITIVGEFTIYGIFQEKQKQGRIDIWIPTLSVAIECKMYNSQKKDAEKQLNFYNELRKFDHGLVAIAENFEYYRLYITTFLIWLYNKKEVCKFLCFLNDEPPSEELVVMFIKGYSDSVASRWFCGDPSEWFFLLLRFREKEQLEELIGKTRQHLDVVEQEIIKIIVPKS